MVWILIFEDCFYNNFCDKDILVLKLVVFILIKVKKKVLFS